MTGTRMQALVSGLGEPGYRAKQLQHWIYQRLAVSFDEMTDLPKAFRSRLAQGAQLHSLTPAHQAVGRDGTVKALFALSDGKTIESALMPHPAAGGGTRHTICLSTQVGCPIGCPFCATGQQGFERNLTPGEIIDQVLYFARRLRDRSDEADMEPHAPAGRIGNLAFMGMGEPLANYDAVLQAVGMLNSPQGFGLGARSMTISTAGLIPGIKRLGREKLQLGLAVSLHAGDDALRDELVPVNRRYPLRQLIDACRQYCETSGRRISFEYALFAGINDSTGQARSLAGLLSGLNCHVNLIPSNLTGSQRFRPPDHSTILAFQRELKRQGIACTLRQKKGLDIDAGCGQMRSRLAKALPK